MVLPNLDPFGQTEKGERGGGCKNWAFFMDVINVWSFYVKVLSSETVFIPFI